MESLDYLYVKTEKIIQDNDRKVDLIDAKDSIFIRLSHKGRERRKRGKKKREKKRREEKEEIEKNEEEEEREGRKREKKKEKREEEKKGEKRTFQFWSTR